MSIQDWAALCAAVTTVVGTVALGIRWMVKHYLSELRPNGGSSLRDSVNRLEERVDRIYEMLSNK
jgi:hypothetical protein